MDNNHPLVAALRQLTNDLRLFIELSLHESDASWEEWLRVILKEGEVRCWERKNCTKRDCPAYLQKERRCWLTAGTMCGETVHGEFALKYKSCTECEVYQEAVFKDPVTEVYEHIVTLVHNLKASQDKLKVMAIRDSLTGVYNRNFFHEIISNEIERTKRYGEDFSLIMVDIDNFKKINDNHGHFIGDWVLRECAHILHRSVRSSDLLARFGGDEFIIATPETDIEGCDALIARVGENLSDWNRKNNQSDYTLSVSIGCARFEQGMDLMEVLKEADTRMYHNKLRRKTSHLSS